MKKTKILLCVLFALALILPAAGTKAAAQGFDYQYVTQSSNPTLAPGESAIVWIKLKNTGQKVWSSEVVRLGTSNSKDRVSAFMPSATNAPELINTNTNWISENRIRMEKATAEVGETVGFGFYIKAPTTQPAGKYKEYFRPVVDGMDWMRDIGIYWEITVVNNVSMPAPDFAGAKTFCTEKGFTIEARTEDMGSWTAGYDVCIFADESECSALDYKDGKCASGQFSQWSLGSPVSFGELVPPITPPEISGPGEQVENTFGVYRYAVVSQSPYPASLEPNQIINVWIDIKNTGDATWNKEGLYPVRLGTGSMYGAFNQRRDYASEFAALTWPSPNRASGIDKEIVNPGELARFQFDIKTPSTPGLYRAYFTPVVDGITWMSDQGIYWEIMVGEELISDNQPAQPDQCIGEGQALGALVPGNEAQCCAGLVPYIPEGLMGSRGTCEVLQ